MNSTMLSSGTPADNTELFQDLLNRLRDVHHTTVEGLQSKVNKLKKERCLDAQKLEEFYNKNQLLREQQKNLQESVSVLKQSLQSGPCDRCRETEKQVKKTQAVIENQNQALINELKAERDILKEENTKLHLELEQLRGSGVQQTSFTEPEEGMIPDSPMRPLSFPVLSKMKRKRDQSHIRYAEKPLSQPLPDLQKAERFDPLCYRSAGVLVPETCDMDVTDTTEGNARIHGRTVVAETCRLDLCDEKDSDSDGDSRTLLNTSPKQPHREASIKLPSSSMTNPPPTASKSCDSPSVLRGGTLDSREKMQPVSEGGRLPPPLTSQSNSSISHQEKGRRKLMSVSPPPPQSSSLEDEELGKRKNPQPDTSKCSQKQLSKLSGSLKVQELRGNRSLESDLDRPDGPPPPCKNPSASQNFSHNDQSWSLDPGAALSQYGTDSPLHPEGRAQTETVDMDYTYVSHSMLERCKKRTELELTGNVTGIGKKANDSLANIFDTTGYGEYESCPQDDASQIEQDHVPEDEEEREQDEEQMDEEDLMEEHFHRPSSPAREKPTKDTDEKNKSFACVEVVRKKHERRKLQGHTCKECEIYYADLPEEERRKKLTSCSRHRFRYIPPSTPENFWEVGFPSTQTCVERGYIKEETHAEARLRRRRPYLAMFSPKSKASKS